LTSTALDLNHHQAAPAAALAIQSGQITWDAAQAAALAQLGLKDASDGDRAVFLHVCQRTGLDPFARQIYMIARNEKIPGTRDQWRVKWTIQTGIDGHRVNRARAEREHGVRGTLGRAIFYDHDGNEHKVWVQPRPPAACEITYTVRDRDGNETPYTSVLRFGEYCQTGSDGNAIAQWKTKPAHMLEKCTEADVYRKAFPQDFSGIYLDDAMPQDTPAADGTPDGRPRGRVTAGEVLDRGPAAQDEPKASPRTARRKTAAAGDDTRSRPRSAEHPSSAQDGQTGERTARDAVPRAAGAAPSRGAQPLPPLPAEDEPTGVGASAPDSNEPAGSVEAPEPAEYSSDRHRKLAGAVQGQLKRLGYAISDDDREERIALIARLAQVAYDPDKYVSTNNFEEDDLSVTADTLARCKNRDALDALLNAGEVGD
jgi:phage recombination protein Bet